MQGSVIERYEILEEIGRGGMGVVYRARHVSLGKIVAIKVLPPELAIDEATAERFTAEARTLAALDCAQIVPVHDLLETGGRYYIVMEYVDGESLDQRLRRLGALPPTEAIAIAREVCLALQYAHDHGVIHRDVKPGNILLTPDRRVKLVDFGIFRDLGRNTRTHSTLGTPQYMAPEQVEDGAVDARTDIYSLGIVLYEMLVGRPPFDGQSAITIAYKQVHEQPPPLTGMPGWITAIVNRCLAKRPEVRYASASDLYQALDRGLEAQPVTQPTNPTNPLLNSAPSPVSYAPGPEYRPASPVTLARTPVMAPGATLLNAPRKRFWLPLLGGLLALLLLGVSAVRIWLTPRPDPEMQAAPVIRIAPATHPAPVVTATAAHPAPAVTTTAAKSFPLPGKDGWLELFSGKDLVGWTITGADWGITDQGVLYNTSGASIDHLTYDSN